jgi:flavin reductase (DIM6/NTAB) family NADH-FMN oxidoreductase RutF
MMERDPFLPVPSFHYLLHPYHTSLVTCCDSDGNPNIITIAWLIPVSIQPPLLGMSIRPTRYSYGLIQSTREFVVNLAPQELVQQVLFCGRRSGRDVEKFTATGLTAGQARRVRPPIIEECLAHLECRTAQDIEAGDHHFVIGEVLEAYAQPGILNKDGLYDLSTAHPLLHLGRNRFTTPSEKTSEPQLPT